MSTQEEVRKQVISEKPDIYFEAKDGEKIRIISSEDEQWLDEKFDNIIKFLKENHAQNLSEGEKDELYKKLKDMWNEVSGKTGKLNSISFDLVLHRDEHKFLVDLITNKMEYDVDTVFYAIELDKMIREMISNNKYNGDDDAKGMKMTPLDITYLYHIISKHKVKGLNQKTKLFASVISSVGVSSKVFNYYSEMFKNISDTIQKWVLSLDDESALSDEDRKFIGMELLPQPVVDEVTEDTKDTDNKE